MLLPATDGDRIRAREDAVGAKRVDANVMVSPPPPVVGLLRPRDETAVDEVAKEDVASERNVVFVLEGIFDGRESRDDEVDTVDVALLPFVELPHPGAGRREVATEADVFVSREDVDPPRPEVLLFVVFAASKPATS